MAYNNLYNDLNNLYACHVTSRAGRCGDTDGLAYSPTGVDGCGVGSVRSASTCQGIREYNCVKVWLRPRLNIARTLITAAKTYDTNTFTWYTIYKTAFKVLSGVHGACGTAATGGDSCNCFGLLNQPIVFLLNNRDNEKRTCEKSFAKHLSRR